MSRRLSVGIGLLALTTAGCINPWNTRFPTLFPRSTASEQGEAAVQDPFPIDDNGPEVGFRPTDYQERRSEPQQAKDQAGAAFLRQQYGTPGGGAPAGPGGVVYPDSVR